MAGKWLELGGLESLDQKSQNRLESKIILCLGMGLERLAMLVLGLDDIRQLYISDVENKKSTNSLSQSCSTNK